MNYCIPFQELSGIRSTAKTFQVSTYIKSTEAINTGLSVKYQAGTYIELNPGFSSGTDFLAEINPCVSVVTIIAAKTDDTEQSTIAEPIVESKINGSWLKVYPTILPSGNILNVESSKSIDGLELQLFNIEGKHIRSYKLNGFGESTKATLETSDLQTGFYYLHAVNGSDLFTRKIIIQ